MSDRLTSSLQVQIYDRALALADVSRIISGPGPTSLCPSDFRRVVVNKRSGDSETATLDDEAFFDAVADDDVDLPTHARKRGLYNPTTITTATNNGLKDIFSVASLGVLGSLSLSLASDEPQFVSDEDLEGLCGCGLRMDAYVFVTRRHSLSTPSSDFFSSLSHSLPCSQWRQDPCSRRRCHWRRYRRRGHRRPRLSPGQGLLWLDVLQGLWHRRRASTAHCRAPGARECRQVEAGHDHGAARQRPADAHWCAGTSVTRARGTRSIAHLLTCFNQSCLTSTLSSCSHADTLCE